MPDEIIDGKRWIRERLAFLREQLDAGPGEVERAAIEAEIETLRGEPGLRGPFRPGLPGRFRLRRRSRR
ncbi:MAG: hypothetical protein ACRDY7_14865 [Acidimicrobiia bacterium]